MQSFNLFWLDSLGRRPSVSFGNKVVTEATEEEGEAGGLFELKIQPAKPDVMQQPEKREPK